jgi:hypothetical protein
LGIAMSEQLIDKLFSQRDKTLLNSLSGRIKLRWLEKFMLESMELDTIQRILMVMNNDANNNFTGRESLPGQVIDLR